MSCDYVIIELMKKFFIFSLVLGFLFSVSALVQAAENGEGPAVQPGQAVEVQRYGLQLKPYIFGEDFRDNFPHSSSTLEILSNWAWADQVGGWRIL